MKHSVCTTHVGPWLHRHRLSHIHIHTRKRTSRTQPTRIPGGPKVVLVDARATRSIRHVASCTSTPRNVGAPLPRRPCLFSFPLSFSSSLLSANYFPSTPWPTYSPTPEKRDDTVETGFRPAEDSGRKVLGSAEFFGIVANDVEKKIYIYIRSFARVPGTKNADNL